ncbi:hypothetical protein C8Q74DRAFT_1407218 [Fomes fomentarius]|nr:hypothetical protein C8Q74DRAFT_1407218 [Fomes fomentarius]
MTQGLHINIHKDKRQLLGTILVQNGMIGTIYFIVLLCLNVCHLSFSLANIFIFTDGSPISYISTFTKPITTILVSHFLLDLQEAYQRTVRVDSDDVLNLGSNSSTPSFVDRVTGSIGSDIHFATPEAKDNSDTTGTGSEDTRGDRSDDIAILKMRRPLPLESQARAAGGPAKQQDLEKERIARADDAWEDSEEILEVPRTPVAHGGSKNRAFP